VTSFGSDRPARREAKLLALIGTGHFFSHFYLIVLPPLFPLLEAELGVGYAALGLLLSLPNLACMVFQTPVGFLVDRFGARRPLVIGLIVMGGAVAAAGVAPGYGALMVIAVLMGVGNSVFHPADYAILAARIEPGRLGRAFSLHTFAGNLGWAVAPAIVVFLAAWWSWQVALITVGLCGVAVALVILTQGQELETPRTAAKGATPTAPPAAAKPAPGEPKQGGLGLLLSAPMLLLFAYMMMSSIASGGLNGFTVTALVELHGADLVTANAALTALLAASAAGVLAGGVLADRTRRHDLIISAGVIVAAGLLVIVGLISLPLAAIIAAMTVVGLARGAIQPSRDMMVRNIAPEGRVGTVFGFVTTGMNVGGALAPVFFGWLIDAGYETWVFIFAALAMLLALLAALAAGQARQARQASPAPAE
jgi:FSR family fosmidomycin resistance protein-like MFS transporter